MRRDLKNNKKIVALLLIVIILVFPIIVLCPSRIGIIPRDIGLTIVGYGGAIIGGFLTLCGVWWTIEENNTNKKKELELQYCPILSASIIDNKESIYQLCSEIIIQYEHEYFSNEDLIYRKKMIKIGNVGRGEIKSTQLRLKYCKTEIVYPDKFVEKIDSEKSYILSDGVFDFIPINGAFYLYIALPNLIEACSGLMNEKSSIRLEISLEITIEGIFSIDEQNYLLHFYMDVPVKTGTDKCNIYSMSFIKY